MIMKYRAQYKNLYNVDTYNEQLNRAYVEQLHNLMSGL